MMPLGVRCGKGCGDGDWGGGMIVYMMDMPRHVFCVLCDLHRL